MVSDMNTLESREESTRKAILHFLKRRGEADAKAVAKFCGLTTMAVGRHLLKLKADGLIQTRSERRSRGRPAAVHSLTDDGDGQFPRDYAGLAIDVLSSLVQLDGQEKLRQVFRKRRATMQARYRSRTKGKKFEERVHEVADVLTECGYMAELKALGHGEFFLTLCNCAIRDVAKRFPETYEEELFLIRSLAGGKVTRVSHLLTGDQHCSYRICAKGSIESNSGTKPGQDEDDV